MENKDFLSFNEFLSENKISVDGKTENIKKEIISCLDEFQKEAVIAPLQNVLCIASAGSGKTHMLTNRIAYHIACGEPEASFMLLTFTNKAAEEMLSRIKKVLRKEETEILSGTFHHIAVVFLRKFGDKIGLKRNFEILDVSDAESLVSICRKKYIEQQKIDAHDFPNKSIIYNFYSKSINLNKPYDEINSIWSDKTIKDIANIIEMYKNKKQELNFIDFDDLLVYFNELLKIEEVNDIITEKYQNIFVDEYQDINFLQNEIIEKLNRYNKLTVVGDDCQCIYAFRGSKFDYIYNFEKNHPNTLVFNLKNNYRSSEKIVDLASNSINKNIHMIKKEMIAYNKGGLIPTYSELKDDNIQAQYICYLIKKYLAATPDAKYEDIAILVRTNASTRFIESTFNSLNIPYKMQCGITFFERKHIKEMVAFAKFIFNKKDEISFNRLICLVNGIGAKTAEKIYENIKKDNYLLSFMKNYKVPSKSIKQYEQLVDCLCYADCYDNLEEQLTTFYNNFYKKYCINNFEDYEDRLNDIDILLSNLSIYKDVQAFLDESSLNFDDYENLDNSKSLEEIQEEKNNRVTISTIHKAKGLEWKKVIIPYLNEGIFPKRISYDMEEEEERRLFYVAITRAQKELNMLSIKTTFDNPKLIKSRYIQELNGYGYQIEVIR